MKAINKAEKTAQDVMLKRIKQILKSRDVDRDMKYRLGKVGGNPNMLGKYWVDVFCSVVEHSIGTITFDTIDGGHITFPTKQEFSVAVTKFHKIEQGY
jgi:hypothetical protein